MTHTWFATSGHTKVLDFQDIRPCRTFNNDDCHTSHGHAGLASTFNSGWFAAQETAIESEDRQQNDGRRDEELALHVTPYGILIGRKILQDIYPFYQTDTTA
jgi:hypothetical protein